MSTVWESADAVPPCWIPLTCQSLGRWERFGKGTNDVVISFELNSKMDDNQSIYCI